MRLTAIPCLLLACLIGLASAEEPPINVAWEVLPELQIEVSDASFSPFFPVALLADGQV